MPALRETVEFPGAGTQNDKDTVRAQVLLLLRGRNKDHKLQL